MNNSCIAKIINKISFGTTTTTKDPVDCSLCAECTLFAPPPPEGDGGRIGSYEVEHKGKKECKDIEYKIEIWYMTMNLCNECAQWEPGYYSFSQTTTECGKCEADTSNICLGYLEKGPYEC